MPLPDTKPPEVPRVTAIDGSGGRVVLSFRPTGEAGDAAGFFVLKSRKRNDPGGVVNPKPLPANVRSFTDEAVEGGSLLYYRLVAVDDAGNRSLPSDPPNGVRIGAPPLSAPPRPSARFETRPYARVVFQFATPGAPSARYALERRDPNGRWRLIQGPLPAGETRAQDPKPPRSGTAVYRLIVIATTGEPGPASPTVEVEIPSR